MTKSHTDQTKKKHKKNKQNKKKKKNTEPNKTLLLYFLFIVSV